MSDIPHEAERCTEHDWELFPLQDPDGMDHWIGPCPWCEINHLRDRLHRAEVECEAWRSGRLLLIMVTNPDPARPFYTPMFDLGDMAGSPFDTITAAVAALLAEQDVRADDPQSGSDDHALMAEEEE